MTVFHVSARSNRHYLTAFSSSPSSTNSSSFSAFLFLWYQGDRHKPVEANIQTQCLPQTRCPSLRTLMRLLTSPFHPGPARSRTVTLSLRHHVTPFLGHQDCRRLGHFASGIPRQGVPRQGRGISEAKYLEMYTAPHGLTLLNKVLLEWAGEAGRPSRSGLYCLPFPAHPADVCLYQKSPGARARTRTHRPQARCSHLSRTSGLSGLRYTVNGCERWRGFP